MKNLVFLMMAFFALSFTACSDDDDDTLAQRVEGIYSGEIKVSLPNVSADTFPNKTVSVVATGDNVVTLSLKEFAFGGMNVGDIVIPGIQLTEKSETDEDGTWTYAEPKGSAKVTINLGTPTEVTVKVDGAGSYIDLDAPREIRLEIEVSDVVIAGQNVTISVYFDGKRK